MKALDARPKRKEFVRGFPICTLHKSFVSAIPLSLIKVCMSCREHVFSQRIHTLKMYSFSANTKYQGNCFEQNLKYYWICELSLS